MKTIILTIIVWEILRKIIGKLILKYMNER